MHDLTTTVETIVDENDTGLHILDMNLSLESDEDDPYQRAFLNITGTIAQLEADMIRERVRSRIEAARSHSKHTGRVPFGFGVGPEGYLTPNEDYDLAVEVLERVAKGESKRATARFAGVSRSTVGRITDRVELYREFDADWKAAADGGSTSRQFSITSMSASRTTMTTSPALRRQSPP